MPDRNSLINALDPIFTGVVGQAPNLNTQNTQGNIALDDVVYECYLYALVLEAINELHYPISPNPAGPGPFVFRRSRGTLHQLKRHGSIVTFVANGNEYDLLCDVETACRSPNVELEIDILIVPKSHSDACATGRKPPSYQQLRLLIEAKHYAAGIDVTTSKSFVGVCDRLRVTSCVASLVTSGPNTPGSKLLLDGVTPQIDLYSNIHGDPAPGSTARGFVDFLVKKLPAVL